MNWILPTIRWRNFSLARFWFCYNIEYSRIPVKITLNDLANAVIKTLKQMKPQLYTIGVLLGV